MCLRCCKGPALGLTSPPHCACLPGSDQKAYAYKGEPCSPCPEGTETRTGGLSGTHLNSELNGYVGWRACVTQPGYGAQHREQVLTAPPTAEGCS